MSVLCLQRETFSVSRALGTYSLTAPGAGAGGGRSGGSWDSAWGWVWGGLSVPGEGPWAA